MFLIPAPRMYSLPSALCLAILLGIISGCGDRSSKADQRTVVVEKGSVEDVITAQGKLEPKDYVDVGLQVSGQIKMLHVDVDNVVKKGQLLVEIDPRLYQSRIEEDQAQIKSLKAQLLEQEATFQLAESQFNRNEQIYKQNVISKDVYDQSVATLKQAGAKIKSIEAQVEQAESQLKSERTNLGYTNIYAPMSGVVATLPVRVGQTLNAVQSAPVLMQLANLDVMTVRAQVAEADVPRVTVGMRAYFTTLGDMEHRWLGTVRLIQPSPEIINDVVFYDVLIDVDNKGRKLMNGMSTQVFFQMGKADDVLLLPTEALGKRLSKEDNEQGKAYQVQVLKNGKAEAITIHTGLSDRTRVEVKSGLDAGDEVVIPSRNKNGNASNRSGIPPGMAGPRL